MGAFLSQPEPTLTHVDHRLSTIINFIAQTIKSDLDSDASNSRTSRFYQYFDKHFETVNKDGEQILTEKLLSVHLREERPIEFGDEKPSISEVSVEDDQRGTLKISATVQAKLKSMALKLGWAAHWFNVFPKAPTDVILTDLTFDGKVHLSIDRTNYPEIKLTAKLANVLIHFDVGSIGVHAYDTQISEVLSLFAHFYTNSLAKEIQSETFESSFSMALKPFTSAKSSTFAATSSSSSTPTISEAERAMRARHAQELAELHQQETRLIVPPKLLEEPTKMDEFEDGTLAIEPPQDIQSSTSPESYGI